MVGDTVAVFPAARNSVFWLIDPTKRPLEVAFAWMLVMWSGAVKGLLSETTLTASWLFIPMDAGMLRLA